MKKILLLFFLAQCNLSPEEQFTRRIAGQYRTGNVSSWFNSQLGMTVSVNTPVSVNDDGAFTINGAVFTIDIVKDATGLWAVYQILTQPDITNFVAISVAGLNNYAVNETVFTTEVEVKKPLFGVKDFLIKQ